MNSLDILKSGDGWVKFTYPDSSIKLLRTTLNTEFIHSMNVDLKEGYLLDLDRMEQFKIPHNASVTITSDKPELDEINEFASRFI